MLFQLSYRPTKPGSRNPLVPAAQTRFHPRMGSQVSRDETPEKSWFRSSGESATLLLSEVTAGLWGHARSERCASADSRPEDSPA